MKAQAEALAASWHARAEALEHADERAISGRAVAFFTACDELRTLIPKLELLAAGALKAACVR